MEGALLMEYAQQNRFPGAEASLDRELGSPLQAMLQQIWHGKQAEAQNAFQYPNQVQASSAENLQAARNSQVGGQRPPETSSQPGFPAMEAMNEAVFLEPAPMQLDACEADPLKDPVFNYISDMLMDEDADDRTCMFIDASGYQAMAKELNQLISDSSSSGISSSEAVSNNEVNKTVDSWINGLFNSEEVGTAESPGSVSSCEPPSQPASLEPVPDEVYEKTLNKFLGSVQNDIEKSTPTASSEMSVGRHGVTGRQEVLSKPRDMDALCKDFLGLRTLLAECSEYLSQPNDCMPEHPPWYEDLSTKEIEAGLVRDVEVDSKALETQKAIREEVQAKLIECAQAVGADDLAKAYEIVNSIRDQASPHGNGTQRLVFYFSEALVARITGTGALLYSALTSNRPSANEMLKAYRLFTRYSPNVRISHYFCNQTILDASKGASRVHIVDYGILYGFGWPGLIKAFSLREGGPPHLRITGIEFPQPGFKPAERIEETGRRLSEYAKQVGVPFEFHAVATTKWESVQASTLFIRHDEVLIVNSAFRLRHLLDESVMVDSPRKLVLSRIRSMKPKVFIQAVVNVNYNAPFFMTRFREALAFYSTIFEAIDTAISPEYPERLLIEQSIMGREILNVVACEGLERVERAESYKQWQSRTSRAGFQQLPLRPEIYAKTRAMLSTYHKSFGIGQDANWLLLGWKETVLHAMCTWRAL